MLVKPVIYFSVANRHVLVKNLCSDASEDLITFTAVSPIVCRSSKKSFDHNEENVETNVS